MLEMIILIGVIVCVICAITTILGWARCNPTFKGIIISLIFGLLPPYLILCFFGLMGEERQRK